MRVVAGEHRGRRLQAPKGTQTRPTADRVREALFSMLGDVSDLRVLDLFAGSGALGIEALSRGARSAAFVDSDSRAIRAIERNLSELGLVGDVHRRDALAFLEDADRRGPYDLVFVDPPYSSVPQLLADLVERLPAVLAAEALTVTESDKRMPLILPLPLVRERVYGDTRVAIHRV